MDYEQKALLYAEKYGIIDYKVDGCTMTYEVYYSVNEVYMCTVDLITMKEVRKLIE